LLDFLNHWPALMNPVIYQEKNIRDDLGGVVYSRRFTLPIQFLPAIIHPDMAEATRDRLPSFATVMPVMLLISC
jgi:hypothetical protein